MFVESDDSFKVGEIGDLQSVATREDSPIDLRVPWWNDIQKRFDTIGSSYITIDTTTDAIYAAVNDTPMLGITSSTIQIGDAGSGEYVLVNGGANNIQFWSGGKQLEIDANGVTLASGASVNEILDSGDALTALSTDDQLATAKLIYTEIEALANQLVEVVPVSSDSTATTGDVILANTAGGDINIDLQEAENAKIIVKKISGDANDVIISGLGTIDGAASVTLDTQYQSLTFVCDGTNWYIV